MKNQPEINRELLLPMGIGVISLVGLGLIFLIIYLNRPPAPVPVEPTPTVLGYLFIGTETATSTPLPELEAAPSEEIVSADLASAKLAGTDVPGDASANVLSTQAAAPAVSETPTVGPMQAFLTGKYDDTNLRIDYANQWAIRGNLGTAFEGTLHISTEMGNKAKFRFVGQRIYLGYQRGPESSTMTITIDGDQYVLNQAAGNIWISPELPSGDHSVTLTHESGETVSLDYITVIGES